MFFVFEGLDGAGKSTQIRLLAEALREATGDDSTRQVITCRDPGSTPAGEAIRALLLDPAAKIGMMAEMLLYMSARAQLVEEVIRPALDGGNVVISDRFLLSNVVYQGHAGGLSVEEIWRIGRIATKNLQPRLTFVLDLPANESDKRIDRPRDRLESRGEAFRLSVRDGFLREAAVDPENIFVVDGSQPIEEVHAEIKTAALACL
ncbi:MAG: dTMP kinase [Pirellulales bacterium]|nr:dTMP kinase [Pirellulales bacterium]